MLIMNSTKQKNSKWIENWHESDCKQSDSTNEFIHAFVTIY